MARKIVSQFVNLEVSEKKFEDFLKYYEEIYIEEDFDLIIDWIYLGFNRKIDIKKNPLFNLYENILYNKEEKINTFDVFDKTTELPEKEDLEKILKAINLTE